MPPFPDDVERLADDVERLADDVEWLADDVEWLADDVERLADDVEWLPDDVEWLPDDVEWLADDVERLADNVERLVEPAGVLSLLVRNGDALAMRPGLLGDWDVARRAFDSSSYDNRIRVTARADRLDDLAASLSSRQMTVRAWYGVRVFTDTAAADAVAPGEPELSALLACEERPARQTRIGGWPR